MSVVTEIRAPAASESSPGSKPVGMQVHRCDWDGNRWQVREGLKDLRERLTSLDLPSLTALEADHCSLTRLVGTGPRVGSVRKRQRPNVKGHRHAENSDYRDNPGGDSHRGPGNR